MGEIKRINEREMNQTADEKGGLEAAKSYYLQLYFVTPQSVN